MCKEQSVLSAIINFDPNEKISLQFNFLNFKIIIYFPECNLTVESYELGHTDRNKNYENDTEEKIKDSAVKFEELVLMQKILKFLLKLEE